MKTGRNDPCPCGSGKKYKKCCLNKMSSPGAEQERRRVSIIVENMFDRLMSYAEDVYRWDEPDGYDALDDAWDEFRNERYDEVLTFENPWNSLFLPYFLFFWYPDDRKSTEHDIIAAKYLRESACPVMSNDIQLLESGLKEPLTFWEILDVQEGTGVLARDIILDREFFILDESLSQSTSKWDIVFGFLFRFDAFNVFGGISPILMPGYLKPGILRSLADYPPTADCTMESLRDMDLEMLEFLHQIADDLMHPQMPEIRNTDGQKIVITESWYAFSDGAAESIIKTLHSLRNIESLDEADETHFKWIVSQNEFEATLKGRIDVDVKNRELYTICNSTERDRALKKRLLKHFPDILTHLRTEKSRDPGRLADASPFPEDHAPASLDPASLSPEDRQELEKLIEKMHMRWADESVPALDGKTPRQAVRSASGRQRVTQLIRDHENLDARNPQAQMFLFDYNKLRRDLGLPEE